MIKRLFCIAVFIFLFAASGACELSSDLNRKGLTALKEGRYQDAIVYFESAHNSEPDDKVILKNLSIAYHYYALQYASNKDWHNAIQNEQIALKRDPENPTFKEQLAVFYNNYGLEYSDKKRYDLAENYLKDALKYSPDSKGIKENLYNVLLTDADNTQKAQNEYKAISLVKDAIELMPQRPQAYILLGNIYYQQDNFKDALANWEKAIQIEPTNQELKSRIEKINKEKAVEEDFRTRSKQHFRIRFDRELDSNYVSAISEILEDARRNVRSEFNLYSDEIIPVIIYSSEQFTSATDATYWTAGLYDGKIRLRLQDLSGSQDVLKKVLCHEYAHAILFLNFGGNIPAWFHEGFAQYNEPENLTTPAEKRFLSNYLKEKGGFSLENLNGMFSKDNNLYTIQAGYLESKLFFEYLMENYDKYRLKRMLEEFKAGTSWEEALKKIYHRSVKNFNEELNKYLEGILAS